jgi:hypothetical protein
MGDIGEYGVWTFTIAAENALGYTTRQFTIGNGDGAPTIRAAAYPYSPPPTPVRFIPEPIPPAEEAPPPAEPPTQPTDYDLYPEPQAQEEPPFSWGIVGFVVVIILIAAVILSRKRVR